jgi:hypothetical protein
MEGAELAHTISRPAEPVHRAISLNELQALAETPFDKLRLAARFATTQVASSAREIFIESAKAAWHNTGPETYAIQSAKRSVAATRRVGKWALGKGLIPPEEAADLLLPVRTDR